MDSSIKLTPNTEMVEFDWTFLRLIYDFVLRNEAMQFGAFCVEFSKHIATDNIELYYIDYVEDGIEIWKREDHEAKQRGEPPFIRIS